MLALAATGRWLGGRTNYGYTLVDTDLPHPNRRKAAAGARLRTLVPDPDTAPIVRRIFQLFDAGNGYRSIAKTLEREGHLSPGEVGPTRHPRSVGVWSGSAVRAILLNPRYLGHQVAGRLRRHDELVDPTDAALGTTSRQRWQARNDWSWSDDLAWPALVDADLWERVNRRIRNNVGTRARQPRSDPGKYLLSGMLRCGHCGKSMHGTTAKSKAYYRCDVTRPDYATPAVPGHPPSYTVREERLVAALDEWLSQLTSPEQLDTTIASILTADDHQAEPDSVVAARRRQVRLNAELDRMLAAIRAGMDPAIAAAETRKIQAELAEAAATMATWQASGQSVIPLTEDQIRDAVSSAAHFVRLLKTAERTDRTALYRALGVQLRYKREAPTGLETIQARLELCSSGGGI